MNAFTDFIDEKMNTIFEDFRENVDKLTTCCKLKYLRYNNGNVPDYSKKIIQQLYLLRYFPAYIVEYYNIYDDLISKGFLDNYNVLSIGSGCCIDYYGLYFALDKVKENFTNADFCDLVCYTGIDRINWKYKDNLENQDFYFLHEDITNWQELDWDNYNVIMFPKSIGEFDNLSFQKLLEIFENSSFEQDKLCLISSVREQNDDIDMTRLNNIVNIFKNKHNYTCLDNTYEYTHFIENVGFAKYYPFYHYPNNILYYTKSLTEKCDTYKFIGETCDEVCTSLNKSPILKTGHVKYQIIRLER